MLLVLAHAMMMKCTYCNDEVQSIWFIFVGTGLTMGQMIDNSYMQQVSGHTIVYNSSSTWKELFCGRD